MGHAMSSLYASNDPPRQPPLRLPDCPRCGEPMRLVRTQPHPRLFNLDERFFRCPCGEETSDIVARVD
jgi:hypothetical protein